MKNLIRHLKFLLIFFLVLLSALCNSPVSEIIRVHPSRSRVSNPAEIFYSEILPTWKGKKVMLVTNPSGIGIEPGRIQSEFQKHDVTISHIIGLEHGFLGLEEEFSKTPVSLDPIFQKPIYHIYKIQNYELRKLISETDYILLDVQGMGMRAYTYVTVLKRIMDSSPEGQALIVIDHITPTMYLEGKGDLIEKKFENFAGEFPSPFFTGMTLGEEARFYNSEYLQNKIRLHVIPVSGYKRNTIWENTGIPWHTPSPNLPTLESARNYIALVFLEGVNVSVGRGTPGPFLYFGAPWMENPGRIAQAMNGIAKERYYFTPVYFKPTFGPYSGKICQGLRMNLVDIRYDPIELAYHLILNIKRLYPENFQWTKWSKTPSIDYLWGNPRFRESIDRGIQYSVFRETYREKEVEFNKRARKYYLY